MDLINNMLVIVGIIFIFCIIAIKIFKRRQNTRILLDLIDKFTDEIYIARKEYFTYSMREKIEKEYKDIFNIVTSKKNNKTHNRNINEFRNIYPVLEDIRKQWNKEYVEKELVRSNDLLSNIDGKSLDNQQRIVVITDEDSNLVIAGAGSGKTLTISAKVKYLVERKGIRPSEILLISFTKKSSQEMYERIYKKLNIEVDVKTFHKLGLDIISKAKERRPDIVEEDFLERIIKRYFKKGIFDEKDMITKFINFVTYYFNVPTSIEEFDNLGEYYDSYKHLNLETIKGKLQSIDKEINELKADYKSIQGEKVKSLEEVNIANFLFLNGIEYIYEYKYPFEQEDRYRKQYRPDFYLPKYDIYIEHFGITKDNRVPWLSEIEEKKYLEGIKWKREVHKNNKTELIETYSYYSKEGILLDKLREKLEKKSVEFDEVDFKDIYEKIYSEKDDNLVDLIKLISTFIKLYKSNGYNEKNFEDIEEKIKRLESKFSRKRAEMFIEITKNIYLEYQKALTDLGCIDFNDMINEATKIIKNNELEMNYKYIIVDEYQDISMSRFNLIKEIKNITNAKLLCVGDDWQSIYRFTGSDINLFTNFGEYVGYYELLKIEKTYRNSQQLIDIASTFITKNPNQIDKNLISDKQLNKPIKIIGYSCYNAVNEIDSLIEEIVAENGVNTEITILARNNKDILRLYDVNDSKDFNHLNKGILDIKNSRNGIKITCFKYPELNINYMTVHKSKGLEAENVIVINLENRVSGFPNKFIDDNLLSLLLSRNEDYPYSEERRLLYVALTRTKNKTYLLTKVEDKSIFVSEIIKDFNIKLEVLDRNNTNIDNPKCPVCITGTMVVRESKDGKKKFLGCTNYPKCNSTLVSTEILDNQIKCVKCGSYMVRRTRMGIQFYGCSNYINGCRNTLPIEIKQVKSKVENSDKNNRDILSMENEKKNSINSIEKKTLDFNIVKGEKITTYSKNSNINIDIIEDKNIKTIFKENNVTNNITENIIKSNKKDINKVEKNKNKKLEKSNETSSKSTILLKDNEKIISSKCINNKKLDAKQEVRNKKKNTNNEIKEKEKIILSKLDKPKKNEISTKDNEIKDKKSNAKLNLNKKIEKKSCDKTKLLFNIGDRVNHLLYGDGEIINVDKRIIKVMFKKGYIQFSYRTCIEETILKKINKEDIKSNEELIQLSEKLYSKNINNKLALETNLRIISNGNKEEKYYFRVAKCYKNLNKIDEAINIYKNILLNNPRSRTAREELKICKELFKLGKYQNPHEKVYHGYYGDGIY